MGKSYEEAFGTGFDSNANYGNESVADQSIVDRWIKMTFAGTVSEETFNHLQQHCGLFGEDTWSEDVAISDEGYFWNGKPRSEGNDPGEQNYA